MPRMIAAHRPDYRSVTAIEFAGEGLSRFGAAVRHSRLLFLGKRTEIAPAPQPLRHARGEAVAPVVEAHDLLDALDAGIESDHPAQ